MNTQTIRQQLQTKAKLELTAGNVSVNSTVATYVTHKRNAYVQ